MNAAISEFLEFLEHEDDTDYGDFKREVDLHLLRMSAELRPLSIEQSWHLQKMREQLLWHYNDDIEEMRELLKSEAQQLESFATPLSL